jgi:hypothetical protein
MIRYTDEQIAAGARALTDHIYGPGAWQKCTPEVQQINCQAFTAGVATLPDHTAELLEALSDLADACTLEFNEKGAGGYALARLKDARAAIANARVQAKGREG